LVEQLRGCLVGGGEFADANLGRHDRRGVSRVVHPEEVPDFVHRDRADRGGVEGLARVMVHRQLDIGVDDPPGIVVGPQRLAADRLVELVGQR